MPKLILFYTLSNFGASAFSGYAGGSGNASMYIFTDVLTTSYAAIGMPWQFMSNTAEVKSTYAKKLDSGQTISWYNGYDSSKGPGAQMNKDGETYYYLALG